jgi:hypothetical protein
VSLYTVRQKASNQGYFVRHARFGKGDAISYFRAVL